MGKNQKKGKQKSSYWVLIALIAILAIGLGKAIYSNVNKQDNFVYKENYKITPSPTTFKPEIRTVKLTYEKINDPQENNLKTYKDKDNLFQFKYPASWARIITEDLQSLRVEEFFEDDLSPVLRDADGIGNDSFYISISKNDNTSLQDIKKKIGSENVSYLNIGGKPALKSGNTYYINVSGGKLFIIARYPDRFDYQAIFDSFTFK